jgi:hypothetical protein
MSILLLQALPISYIGLDFLKLHFNDKFQMNEWMNVAIGCPIGHKGLLIQGKLNKGSRVELVHVSD